MPGSDGLSDRLTRQVCGDSAQRESLRAMFGKDPERFRIDRPRRISTS